MGFFFWEFGVRKNLFSKNFWLENHKSDPHFRISKYTETRSNNKFIEFNSFNVSI